MTHSTLLSDVLIFLIAAVGIVALFKRMRMSPVLGYLAAGAAIGPFGLGVIKNVEGVRGIAEFGVVFLLFMIGLELSFARLVAMRRKIFGFGTLQMLLTGGAIGGVALALEFSNGAAVLIGCGLAMSSTAIVLQVLNEKGEQASRVGRLALAVLILQDLAVVPLLVLVHLLAETQGGGGLGAALLSAMGRAGLVLVGLFVAGRLLLRPLFRAIANLDNDELFTAATLLVLLGTAWLTEHFGLSLALGAFMAGLLIAETEFTHQVEADVMPFKGLFLGLFFMAVGMSVDVHVLIDGAREIVGLTFALMATKTLVILGLCRLFRFRTAPAMQAGLLLSQAGEFAFVLFTLAIEKGVLDAASGQKLLVVVTLSMALTPLAWELGKQISSGLSRTQRPRAEDISEEGADLTDHVVIAGFGRMGRTVASFLTEERMHYIAVDLNAASVAKSRGNGLPAYYGDASRREVLSAMGIERARIAVVTISDVRSAERTVAAIRAIDPDLPIIARARDQVRVQRLEKAGANVAVADTLEASLQLAGSLLRLLGTPEGEIHRVVERFRAHDYALAQAIVSAVEHDRAAAKA